ncbi:carboxypeptidase-like regulatory domain-containing protein [Panacibacter sp. DH6]|uniref:Carboxypeptidase-like regulatory domain-containing protein n=1 Tax=Panacibacter microcysteis TaxID=2793269 RepID=A0A931E6U9_9BACT|nr:DUF5686 family protein [Panacibacter microcysteis]MBG9374821.1 carboxypeptidase-like regulatory domain-containing protein [Panacibacter microcysteis]
MALKKKLGLIILLLTAYVNIIHAQSKTLSGIVLDKQSDEPIPYASVVFKVSGRGMITDSAGKFSFSLNTWPAGDTLQVLNVGYKIAEIPVALLKDSASVTIYIEVEAPKNEAVVKAKYNRALWFWRKIISKKPVNDRSNYSNFGYEVYNKLELDLNKVNRDKLERNFALKPLKFAFDYTDTSSEKDPFLPVYLTETISDYYYEKKPYRTREVIKATNASGFNNESWMKQLGATYQNVNVYSNLIPVLDKSFISPFSDNADNYYNFKLLDTQYLGGRRLVHFQFKPKHVGENTFEGDSWIHDTTFAVQKVTLRPALDANINFVTGLTLIQEYKLVSDSSWFLYKDKFVVDIAPVGANRLGFKGRKTTTYRNVLINSSTVINELNKGKSNEEIILVPNTTDLPDSFWVQHRFEPLNKNEQNIYKLLDTLENNKTFLFYKNSIDFLTTGTKYIGNYVIGPWYYWFSGNRWEGTRVRFDLSTNRGFSQHWYLHGYLAYGFTDKKYKGQAEIKYQFSRKPWSYLLASYKSDLDNGQVVYDQLGSDNVFAVFARKPNVPFKFQQITEKKLEYFTETNKNFSVGLTLSSRQYKALLNLPGKDAFPTTDGEPLNSFETRLRLRYAYQERFLESNFDRSSFGSQYPIVQLVFTHGFSGVLNSSYDYNKIDLSISDYLKIPPYGTLRYNFFAGKVFGTLPYQMLVHQPGNEWYYYSYHSFNLMNRFEYLTDRYAGFNIEHNIGSGLFRYIPITRKLKLRQFWEVKGVAGNLSNANKQLNFVTGAPFKSLDGNLYMEVGTGIDNILKFFRIDFIWRVLPRPLPDVKQQRFGVFGGFRFTL